SNAPTAGGVRATASGTGTIARISACIGTAKEVRLDVIGETADIRCHPATGTGLVKAISAVPQIELRDQLASGAWQQFNLLTGQSMSVGSPATASADNTAAIAVQLLQIDDTGRETVVGVYQLVPGSSVDVALTQSVAGRDGEVRFTVLGGEGPVTLNGVTRTLRPGAPATIPIDRTPPRVACGTPDNRWHADNVTIACVAQDEGVGLLSAADAEFSLTTSVEPGVETAT